MLITVTSFIGCSTTKTVTENTYNSPQVSQTSQTSQTSVTEFDELTPSDPTKPLTHKQKKEEATLKFLWDVIGTTAVILNTFSVF